MGRLSFLVDEKVNFSFVSALRKNSYEVETVQETFGKGTIDEEILEKCREKSLVVLTNDTDFASPDEEHGGIVIYYKQAIPPGDVVRGIRRMEKHLTEKDIKNTVIWLEQWV